MNKIILVSIIKNEEKIIERCLNNILSVIDGICITDTGSTDDTVNVVTNFFEGLNIPSKLYHDEWKNFGHNRSNSFLNAQKYCKELGWDLNKTYGLLLDADMNLVIKNFNKDELIKNGYNIIQENPNLEYYNTRFLKMSFPWKCTGVTHEYWDGNGVDILTKDKIYINDIGDGGCKSDKIDRDIRLLENGILDEPNNGRYYFYLAQSYKDKEYFIKAIELFKIRIKLGGWDEEVWYSYYMISKCHLLLKNEEKFEQWALKAYKYRKNRAEPIYELVKYFRDISQHYKAYHYYLIGKDIPYPTDILFIEKNVYSYCFDYEYSILQYYVFPKERLDGLKNLINYYNNHSFNLDLTFSNMVHYMSRIINDGNIISLDLTTSDLEFKPSSISLLKLDNKILANIRFVNYIIESNGSYTYNNKVITKNAFMYLNYDMHPITDINFINDKLEDLLSKDVHIIGLEDIRLFKNDNNIYYTATSLEYSYNDKIRIIKGKYNLETNELKDNICMIPPTETDCEKNWVTIDNKFIYKWHPLEIGILKDNKLDIIYTHETPRIFSKYRGSSNAFEYNNEYWFVTHGIMDCTPRKYFHQIVILDKNYNIVKYTVPFYFDKFAIEYCLGFIIIKEIVYMTASRNDSEPIIVKIKLKNLHKYFI